MKILLRALFYIGIYFIFLYFFASINNSSLNPYDWYPAIVGLDAFICLSFVPAICAVHYTYYPIKSKF